MYIYGGRVLLPGVKFNPTVYIIEIFPEIPLQCMLGMLGMHCSGTYGENSCCFCIPTSCTKLKLSNEAFSFNQFSDSTYAYVLLYYCRSISSSLFLRLPRNTKYNNKKNNKYNTEIST